MASARESGSGAWSEEDEAIIATNTEAAECKRCAVELGYWQDDYIQYFARRGARKPPEINRGYYARVKLIELFVHQFLERCDTKCQIINLGCGFDTLYWRLKDQTQAIANFIELDLPTVTAKKCSIIKRNKQLLEKIANEDGEVALRGAGELHADGYHLAACDLRAPGAVLRALAACALRPAAPALVLAECVLVYLPAERADALLAALAAHLPRAALLLYEQCSLRDKFGAVMAAELARRGCVSAGAGAGARGDPPELAARARAAGWARAAAWSLRAAAAALPPPPAAARAADPLDEPELLHQLHDHYALLAAHNHAHFADLSLADLQR